MKRILFVAENVTLAQVVRLAKLASALDLDRYELHFASSDFPDLVFAGTPFVRHQLETLAASKAEQCLRNGKRLYDRATLLRYVDAETRLIDRVRPDLVVGDFRLSLSTSAELSGVPSATLINAYWSPHAVRGPFPVPDHPIIGWLGEALTQQYFPQALPRVFRHFAEPLNAARKKRGLAPVGSLLEMLTHGTHTLYPDDPQLTPIAGAPPEHRFIGPVCWEPDVPVEAFEASGDDRPLVYVTLGSSGRVDLLPKVVEALSTLPVRAVVATAGRVRLDAATLPANVRARRYVRGSDAARRASVVVSNGGSTTGYQALEQGTPVVGIPSNLDQFLATQAIVAAGAGLEVKARSAEVVELREAIERATVDSGLRQRAEELGSRFRRRDSGAQFAAWLDAALGAEPAGAMADAQNM